MTAWLLLILAPATSLQNHDADTRALRITTVEDALAILPASSSERIMPVGDIDGDGSVEVALEHWEDEQCWIDFVSVPDGSTVRRLWGGTN